MAGLAERRVAGKRQQSWRRWGRRDARKAWREEEKKEEEERERERFGGGGLENAERAE